MSVIEEATVIDRWPASLRKTSGNGFARASLRERCSDVRRWAGRVRHRTWTGDHGGRKGLPDVDALDGRVGAEVCPGWAAGREET